LQGSSRGRYSQKEREKPREKERQRERKTERERKAERKTNELLRSLYLDPSPWRTIGPGHITHAQTPVFGILMLIELLNDVESFKTNSVFYAKRLNDIDFSSSSSASSSSHHPPLFINHKSTLAFPFLIFS
jgi:hypothetical protein